MKSTTASALAFIAILVFFTYEKHREESIATTALSNGYIQCMEPATLNRVEILWKKECN